MRNFAEYYKDLLDREGVPFQELISDWREDLIAEIQSDFGRAVTDSNLKGTIFVPNETNQSVGNQLDSLAVGKLNKHLKIFEIETCPGKGYPDRILTKGDSKQVALEMKATSAWNPNDTNRRVLTSSSIKLRANFAIPPIYHLICTVIYENLLDATKINTLRLDFIEPKMPVSVRLEASVSHKMLASGTHKSVVF